MPEGSVKPSKEPFSAQLSSLLQRCSPAPVEDSWLLLSVQVGEQAGKRERVMKWGEGKRHLPISITSPLLLLCPQGSPFSFPLCVEIPNPWDVSHLPL